LKKFVAGGEAASAARWRLGGARECRGAAAQRGERQEKRRARGTKQKWRLPV